MSDYEDLQKRCQRGATNLNDANNLLAECYGMLGKLGADVERLKSHVQSMIDQTTPLVPVPDNPGWNRRITIDELSAEVAELRKDAERYRFLKNLPDDDCLIERLECNTDPENWDSVIDAAMSKEAM